MNIVQQVRAITCCRDLVWTTGCRIFGGGLLIIDSNDIYVTAFAMPSVQILPAGKVQDIPVLGHE